jgi:hypothetical protein|tara:strand:+ start:1316 stop:2020 length:705 start_codon:yes stop_codon:yes gene_type:complete
MAEFSIKKLGIFVILVFSIHFFVGAEVVRYDGRGYVSVDIEEGWNLISGISFSSDLHSSSELDLYGLISAYYFDAKTQERVEVRPIYSAGNIGALELYTNAFWVNSLVSGKLVYPASPGFLDKEAVGGFYQFYAGDNLIAINEDMYGKSVNQLSGDCLVNEANYWDAENQAWVSLNLDEPLDFGGTGLIGKGIRVNVQGDCKFFDEYAGERYNSQIFVSLANDKYDVGDIINLI